MRKSMKIKLERDPNVHMVNIHFIRIYIISTFVYRYVYINESLMYGVSLYVYKG